MPAAELSADTMARVRGAWSDLAGAAEFPVAGSAVIVNASSRICPAGWAGIVGIGAAIVATVPHERFVDPFARALAVLDSSVEWDSVAERLVGVTVHEARGPASLAYAGRETFRPSGRVERIDELDPANEVVARFVASVPAADAEEADILSCPPPLFCVSDADAVVAAAGYRVWCDDVAHMSVLVAPSRRGSGLAKAVAGATTEHALAEGLVAQWRARLKASQAVAAALGFVPVGRQISLRVS